MKLVAVPHDLVITPQKDLGATLSVAACSRLVGNDSLTNSDFSPLPASDRVAIIQFYVSSNRHLASC